MHHTKAICFAVTTHDSVQRVIQEVLTDLLPLSLIRLTFDPEAQLNGRSMSCLRAYIRAHPELSLVTMPSLHVSIRVQPVTVIDTDGQMQLSVTRSDLLGPSIPPVIGGRDPNIHENTCPRFCQNILRLQADKSGLAVAHVPKHGKSVYRPSIQHGLRLFTSSLFPNPTHLQLKGLNLDPWSIEQDAATGAAVIPFPNLNYLEVSLCEQEGRFFDWLSDEITIRLRTFVYIMAQRFKVPARSTYDSFRYVQSLSFLLGSLYRLKRLALVFPEDLGSGSSTRALWAIIDGFTRPWEAFGSSLERLYIGGFDLDRKTKVLVRQGTSGTLSASRVTRQNYRRRGMARTH